MIHAALREEHFIQTLPKRHTTPPPGGGGGGSEPMQHPGSGWHYMLLNVQLEAASGVVSTGFKLRT
jgi:hypothetical protein